MKIVASCKKYENTVIEALEPKPLDREFNQPRGRGIKRALYFGNFGMPATRAWGLFQSAAIKVNRMTQKDDSRKRPLLSAEQLRIMRNPKKTVKGTPRQEFEKLFRRTTTLEA